MESLTLYLIAIPALLILSVVVSKGAGRFGIPALSIFLLLGMVVGREGPGGFPFSNYLLAQTLGIIALILILHSGGLGTTIEDVRAVRWPALVLSTVGVVVATALVGAFSIGFLRLGWLHGLLLGAAVSSTDVAAVFTILRSRNVSLAGPYSPAARARVGAERSDDGLPERRPAAADPRARGASLLRLVPMFFQQMILGHRGRASAPAS